MSNMHVKRTISGRLSVIFEKKSIFPSGNLPENVVYINLVLFCVLQRTVF